MGTVGAAIETDVPLARYAMVDTHDPDDAEEAVGRIFCAHRLTPMRRGAPSFHAVHNSASHNGFSVNYVAYGADVEIDPGRLDRFFLLQIPLTGSATVRCGVGKVEASASNASLLSPTLPTLMRWHEGTGKLIVLIERAVVESHLAGLLERTVERIEFAPSVPLETPVGAALRCQALLMRDLSEQAAQTRGRWPLAHRQLRDSMIGMMLAAQPHNYSGRLQRAAAAPAPAHIRRAEEYISAAAADRLTVSDLAAAVGVSVRTLQAGFRDFRDKTLGEAILDARLERWRRLLADPEQRGAVADLAHSAGLPHAGRAAAAFRRRYGEAPAQARRRGSPLRVG